MQCLGIDLTRKKRAHNNEIRFLSVKPLLDLHLPSKLFLLSCSEFGKDEKFFRFAIQQNQNPL